MKNMVLFKKGVLSFGIVVVMVFMTACTSPLGFLSKGEKNNAEEGLFYKNHNEFIKVVKSNLGVPETSGITYNVEEPQYNDELEAETVYVSFVEYSVTVAAAECYTENGQPVRSVLMYTSQEGEKKNEHLQKNTADDYENVKYYTYKNARFGYSIPYPDFLIAQPESDNGDGMLFISADGKSTLNVWGSNGPAVIDGTGTLDGLYDYTINNLGYTPTYKAKNKNNNSFVLSGYKGESIVYEKHILKSDKTENVFFIEYPAELKKEFDPIVTYIAKYMTTGIGTDSDVEK